MRRKAEWILCTSRLFIAWLYTSSFVRLVCHNMTGCVWRGGQQDICCNLGLLFFAGFYVRRDIATIAHAFMHDQPVPSVRNGRILTADDLKQEPQPPSTEEPTRPASGQSATGGTEFEPEEAPGRPGGDCGPPAPFQDVWGDYKEPTETPEFLVLLEQLILMFFRGGTIPNQYRWCTQITWYSGGGGGATDRPNAPICIWSGTDSNIDQFARIDNTRGSVQQDLGNHVYACMVDNMVTLRAEQTLIGQVDTRSEHSTPLLSALLALLMPMSRRTNL